MMSGLDAASMPRAAAGIRPDTVDDELLLARAYLSRVAEPACIPVWDLVRREGAERAARAIQQGAGQAHAVAAALLRRASALAGPTTAWTRVGGEHKHEPRRIADRTVAAMQDHPALFERLP